MSRDVKKLRKLRYHQKLLAWPLNQGIWQKVCYKVNLLKNNGNKNNGPQNTLNMSWNCPNWEQLRAVVYSVNLYHHIHITQHKKALVRVTIKISGCLRWFVNNPILPMCLNLKFLIFLIGYPLWPQRTILSWVKTYLYKGFDFTLNNTKSGRTKLVF